MALPASLYRSLLSLLAIHLLAVLEAPPRAAALPLRHEVSAAIAAAGAGAGGGQPADGFLAALRDEPSGSYSRLLAPLVHAVDITYRTSSGPNFNESTAADATIPPEAASGEIWVRAQELEANPSTGGVHMRVFVSHEDKKVICTFRGICTDNSFRQCEVDKCFLQSYQAFGTLSGIAYKTNTDCGKFAGEINYFEQADSHVKKVQAQFPGYSLLLTGHSLGGALSISVAASQPAVLKAVTFAPTAFHEILLNHAGLSEEDILNLPAQNLIALGDPYDCLINSLYVSNARVGATTCLLEGLDEPAPCQPEMEKDLVFDQARQLETLMCKGETHDWLRYMSILPMTSEGGEKPLNLPNCSTSFSHSQADLMDALHLSE